MIGAHFVRLRPKKRTAAASDVTGTTSCSCTSSTPRVAGPAQGATSEASSAALLTLASQRLFGLAGMVVPVNTP